MTGLVLALFIVTLQCCTVLSKTADTFSAVVVEYHPVYHLLWNTTANIESNVNKFVSVIETASTEYNADIVVFPESALVGFVLELKAVVLPDPTLKIQLCNSTADYDSILKQLACASLNTSTYVVVNLVEKIYNTTLQKTVYFNTDVVFDPNGAVIARYRKIHLYGEGSLSPSPDGELVYFDTDFGVRFGLLTCFDIIFKTPGVALAREYNVTHFIFPTHWFSQMPFLPAVQEQYYWAYTLDVVLLASQYNQPSTGSTGSGIYLGRQGPLVYNMTSYVGTFLLHANVPIQYPYTGSSSLNVSTDTAAQLNINVGPEDGISESEVNATTTSSYEAIFFKRESLDAYTTELIDPVGTLSVYENSTNATVRSVKEISTSICQNSLCCEFVLNISTTFSTSRPNITRGDDYSQLYYRLAVFDGLKDYDGADTGGVQTCAIVSCVNTNLSSCGYRSDSSYAVPNSISNYYQTEFVFQSITITGNISNNNSLVGPNALLTGQDEINYGELLSPDIFVFNETEVNGTTVQMFHTLTPTKIVTASLYGRLFNRDGDPYDVSSGRLAGHPPSIDTLIIILTTVSLLMI